MIHTYVLMIVDDSPVIRKLHATAIRENSGDEFRIIEAESALTALSLLEAHPVDCILLDYQMPDMNGLEFLSRLQEGDHQDIAVIVVTGHGSEDVAVRAMKIGATDYLGKESISGELLVRTVRHAIDRKAAERGKRLDEERIRILQRAVEQSPATVIITDARGAIEYVNQKFVTLTGYARDEAIGANPRILNSGTHPPEYFASLWATIAGGGEWRGEMRNRKKNGECYWEFASISPITNDRGIITHYIGIKEDITAEKAAQDALRVRNEQYEREIRIAQRAQKSVISRELPPCPRLGIDVRYKPMEKVGGDYFAFFRDGESGLGVFIGDVSGHGLSAALFTSLLRMTTDKIFHNVSTDPAAFMASLNDEAVDYIAPYFLTGVYGYFDFTRGDGAIPFLFANGGHPTPLHARADGSVVGFGDHDALLGTRKGVPYRVRALELAPGDRLFLYTDGVAETEDPAGVMMGYHERLQELFASCRRDTLGESLDAVLRALRDYRGGRTAADDVTLIGFEAR